MKVWFKKFNESIFFFFHSNPHVFHVTNFMISHIYIYIYIYIYLHLKFLIWWQYLEKNLLFEIEILWVVSTDTAGCPLTTIFLVVFQLYKLWGQLYREKKNIKINCGVTFMSFSFIYLIILLSGTYIRETFWVYMYVWNSLLET